MASETDRYPWLKLYPKGIDWSAPVPVSPLYDLLGQTVARFGSRPAFDFYGKKSTWGEIGRAVEALAAGLQRMGCKKGDRIGLFLPNTPTYLIAYYAIARMGGVIVNFNPLYAPREISHQIEDSGVRLMITLDLKTLQDKLAAALPQTGVEKVIVGSFTNLLPFPQNLFFRLFKASMLAPTPKDARYVSLEEIICNTCAVEDVTIDPVNDIALLQYTGGTTGVPKGAMLSHANVVANAHQCGMWFSDCREGEDRMLGVIPFFHVFAMTAVLNLSVLKGLEIVAIPRFDLDQTLDLIQKKRPNLFPAVPAIFTAINHHPNLKRYNLKSLRHCVSGGAPLPVEVKKSFEANTGCILVEGYGLTETSPVTHVNPLYGINKPGSIGLPLPGTLAEIIDMNDRLTPMKLGEKGEICITGPQVMKGYWNKEDETANVIRKGRLHTGDIGYMDTDGYIFIVDRMKDMIITNGYNVYPRNVEEAIYMHPDVQECIVAGLPDPERGEKVKAWVVARGGRELTAEGMKSFLRDKLSPMEIPRDFEFRTTPLPKTLIGKLSRKDVVAQELEKA